LLFCLKGAELSTVKTLKTTIKTPRAFSLFCFYIICLILLPSGTLFGVNLKIPIFIPLLLLAINQAAKKEHRLFHFSFNLLVSTVFLGWALLSQFYPFTPPNLALSHYKDVMTLLAGCWFVRLFTEDDEDLKTFLRVCIYTVACSGGIKLSIFFYSLYTGVPTAAVIEGISHAFGVLLIGAEFGDADIGGRLQFGSDNLVPLSIFAILCARKKLKIGIWAALAIMGLLLFSSIYAFSRFLWVSTIFGFMLGFLVAKKDKLHLVYVGATAAFIAYFFNVLSAIVTFRLNEDLVNASDIERVIQQRALHKSFMEAPLLGHGLGSHTTMSIRSIELPYAYELQVPALLVQVGVIGMMLFIFLLLNYYWKAFTFERGVRLYQISVLMLLAVLLASGFFNPTLITSGAAVSFGMLFGLAKLGRTRATWPS
jgi:hypothetical protein